SRHTVHIFFKALLESGKDVRSLSHLQIASVGQTTSDTLKQYGVLPDLQAGQESSRGLIRDIDIKDIASGKALIPHSELALPVLHKGLVELGWKVTTVSIYRNIFPKNLQPLDLSRIQAIAFASPSCVTNFVRLYGYLPKDKLFIFKGNETEKRYNELIKKQK
ncbi:MAG: uroporphyrinogen-III synthase, partial [Bacteroidales bacterium]